jgi:hypothetical protein
MEKTTYYLQYNEDIPHRMIDTVKNPSYLIENSVDSTSWIKAKQELGYELTGEQQMMMDH